MFNWRILRILGGRPRLCAGIAGGLLSFIPLIPVHPAGTRAVLAWDVGSAIYLILTAFCFFNAHDKDISVAAKREQEGEWSVFALTVMSAVVSLGSIFIFSHSIHKSDPGLYLALVVATLLLSWLTVNVTFAFRYAHEYYTRDWNDAKGKVDGGIVFPDDDTPDYLDFIYFAFVLGMTFQVSDCNITSKKFRRLATVHGLIGFVFNTVILALSVNIAASLIS